MTSTIAVVNIVDIVGIENSLINSLFILQFVKYISNYQPNYQWGNFFCEVFSCKMFSRED